MSLNQHNPSHASHSSYPVALLLIAALLVSACGTTTPKLSSFRNVKTEATAPVTADDNQKERIIRNNIIAVGDRTPLRVQARVYADQAILVGEVLNQSTKERLEFDAQRQAKVSKVFNLLEVANPLPEYKSFTDLLLKTRVSFAMAGVKEVDTTRIATMIDRQRIFLMGSVTESEAEILIERLRQVMGVTEVVVVFRYTE